MRRGPRRSAASRARRSRRRRSVARRSRSPRSASRTRPRGADDLGSDAVAREDDDAWVRGGSATSGPAPYRLRAPCADRLPRPGWRFQVGNIHMQWREECGRTYWILLIVGVLRLGLLVAGCGSSDDSTSTTEATTATTTVDREHDQREHRHAPRPTRAAARPPTTSTTPVSMRSSGTAAESAGQTACEQARDGIRAVRQAGRGRRRQRRRHRAGHLPAGSRPGRQVAAVRGRTDRPAQSRLVPIRAAPTSSRGRGRPLSCRDVEPDVVELGIRSEPRRSPRR